MSVSKCFMVNFQDAELDDTCGMKFFYSQLYGGRGITRKDTIISDKILEETHNDLRSLSGMIDISKTAVQNIIDDVLSKVLKRPQAKHDSEKMELLWRRLGWFAAFALYIEPEIRKSFQSVPIDTEIVLNRDPLFVISYPDRALMDRESNETIYQEYLPMPHNLSNRNWLQSWHYNMRLHAGIEAAQDALKTKIAYGQVRGLSLGYVSVLDSKLRHPYTYGFYNEKTDTWSKNFGTETDGKWVSRPVWEYPLGIVKWVELCGKDTAEAQFPLSPNVYLDKRMLDMWTEARLHRERKIDYLSDKTDKDNEHIRHIYFERRTTACRPTYGPPCPYLRACWDPTIQKDPLASKEYMLNPEPQPVELRS